MSGHCQLTTAMDVYGYAMCCVEILTMGRIPWPLSNDDDVRYFVTSAFISALGYSDTDLNFYRRKHSTVNSSLSFQHARSSRTFVGLLAQGSFRTAGVFKDCQGHQTVEERILRPILWPRRHPVSSYSGLARGRRRLCIHIKTVPGHAPYPFTSRLAS